MGGRLFIRAEGNSLAAVPGQQIYPGNAVFGRHRVKYAAYADGNVLPFPCNDGEVLFRGSFRSVGSQFGEGGADVQWVSRAGVGDGFEDEAGVFMDIEFRFCFHNDFLSCFDAEYWSVFAGSEADCRRCGKRLGRKAFRRQLGVLSRQPLHG